MLEKTQKVILEDEAGKELINSKTKEIYVGIKYCGGCNPSFDRVAFAQKLMENHNDLNFESAGETRYYDLLVLVNGCTRACALNKARGKKTISVDSLSQFDYVNRSISELKKK